MFSKVSRYQKASVSSTDGESFLELKLRDVGNSPVSVTSWCDEGHRRFSLLNILKCMDLFLEVGDQ